MTSFPKPRGFWDYAIFALAMTGLLMLLFWSEASDRVGWADAALAFVAALLIVFRRAERAAWIAQPTLIAYLLMVLEAVGFMFGAVYADAYLLHRRDITPSRFWHDVAFAVFFTIVTLWLRRRLPVSTPG